VSRPGWLVSIVVGTLLLAGCSGDEPAASPPSEPPSTTPAASPPTPAPPSLPASARKPTKAGAVAFASFYVELMNHAATTGDVDSLRKFSGERCQSCLTTAGTVRRIYGRGGSIRGYNWRVTRYSALRSGQPRTWVIALGIRARPHLVRDSSSASPRRLAGGRFSISVYAQEVGNGWVVTRMDRVA
jgi:hypothetical protein